MTPTDQPPAPALAGFDEKTLPNEYVTVYAITKADLLKVRAIERESGVLFNLAISDEWLMYLMPGILHPIIDYTLDGDNPVKVLVLLTGSEVGWAEIPREIFDGLRRMEAMSSTIKALKQKYT